MQSPRRKQNGQPSRWPQYLELLERKGVSLRARQGYVARMEAFLREVQLRLLSELTPEG